MTIQEINQPVDLDQLTELEVTDLLLRQRIKHGSGKKLVVIFALEDDPDSNLVYVTTDDTRSMEILNEDGALAKAEFYEDLAERYSHATCESHIVTIASRSEFIPVAKKAIEESGTHEHNTQYLLGVLDSFSEV